MSELDDDIARGCLEDGEPLEARWGTGYWSESPYQQEPDWRGGQCPDCGAVSWYFGGQFVECSVCDKYSYDSSFCGIVE